MTNTDLQNALKGYANEDVALAIEESSMCITGTKKGVISINHENGFLQSFNNMGEELTGKMDESGMVDWLMNQYVVN
jgi:hypothetical protein